MSRPLTGSWVDRLASGDPRLIATSITAVENDTPRGQEILRDIYPFTGNALVVGFTGAPGVGKSTLVSACIRELRRQELTVGVVAVDPSSVFSGGAILGDRVRMNEHSGDTGVFIRSVASRGQLGGLSRNTARVIDVLDASGKDIILVETVGTGQSEIEIAEIAQLKVVVTQPGTGDDIQAMKSGILEIADILVVNKSDFPGADHCMNYLRQMIGLRTGAACDISIIQTNALSGEGVAELVGTMLGLNSPDKRVHSGIECMRRLLVNETCNHLRQSLQTAANTELDRELNLLSEQVLKAELTLDAAVDVLLAALQSLNRRHKHEE